MRPPRPQFQKPLLPPPARSPLFWGERWKKKQSQGIHRPNTDGEKQALFPIFHQEILPLYQCEWGSDATFWSDPR